MTYVAFARKYRPRTFEDVVGQEAIADALRAAVAAQRTASVYLFAGSHGVGKTSMARILAKALGCAAVQDGRPCLACPACLGVERGEALDVIEIDAASNRGVEDAERIRDGVRYRPQGAGCKVYILDEVHQLSRTAFDALLKTFEEAPAHVRFILATTELHKVPATIRSRAQVFHFRRATRPQVEGRLRSIAELEGVPISPAALGVIARRARGSMRDAQKLLDQVTTLGVPAGGAIGPEDVAGLLGTLTDERVVGVLEALVRGDVRALLDELARYLAEGGRPGTFSEELQEALRAVLYARVGGPGSALLEESPYPLELVAPIARALGEDALLYALTVLQRAEHTLRTAREPRVVLEVALVRLARVADLRPMAELVARLERLEEELARGDPGPRAASASPRGPGDAAPLPEGPPAVALTVPAPARALPPGPDRGARPRGYAYPPEMAGGPPAPGPTHGATDAPGRPEPGPKASSPGGFDPSAFGPSDLEAAWARVLPRLGDALGIVASMIERGQPRLRPAPGALALELSIASDVTWRQVEQASTLEALGRLLGEALGVRPPLRLVRTAAAPPPGKAAGGRSSVYDEELVRLAQRELSAQQIQRGPE